MAKWETPSYREHWRYFKTWGPSTILFIGGALYVSFKYLDRWIAGTQASFRDKTALYGRPPEERTYIPWPRQDRNETLPPEVLSRF